MIIYLHELKEQTGLDGNGEVIFSRVFSWNGGKEGVPDGTGPLQHLFHAGLQPHRRTLDPATPEQGLRFCRHAQLQQRKRSRTRDGIDAGGYLRVPGSGHTPPQPDAAGSAPRIWSRRPEFFLKPSGKIVCPASPPARSTIWPQRKRKVHEKFMPFPDFVQQSLYRSLTMLK